MQSRLFWSFRGAGSFGCSRLFGLHRRTGNSRLCFRPYLVRYADHKSQKQQGIEGARGFGPGQPALCDDVFSRDALGKKAKQLPLSIFQVLGLRKAQRVRREVNLKIGVLRELIQRQVSGSANGRQEQPSQRQRCADFRDNIFFKRAEEKVAARRVVKDGRGDLQKLAVHPADNLLDSIDAHFGNCRTKALARLDERRGLLKLALGQGTGAKHHFAKPILPVVARRKHQFAGVEKERLFHPSKDELQLAGKALGVNPMHEGEEGVVAIDFTGIGRLLGGRKPVEWSRSLALLRVQ